MRILAVGDTHGQLNWMDRQVIPVALDNNCTRIMQVGDFGFVLRNSTDAARTELGLLSELLVEAKLDLTFLPGNHENHPALQALASHGPLGPEGHAQVRPRIHYTGRVSAWTWDGIRFAAVGGAASIDKPRLTPGVDWWEEELLTEAEATYAKTLGPVDGLFTHDSPPCIPMNIYADHIEGVIHRQRIGDVAQALRPKRWWHGHYHRHLRYPFHYPGGVCAVTALDRDGTYSLRSMAVIDTGSFNLPPRLEL